MAKQILPTKVKILFDPDEDRKPVTLQMETGPSIPNSKPLSVRECSFHDIKFSYFEGTIKEGVTLMAVPMILPWFFEGIGERNGHGKKDDLRRLFLLRTTVTEAGSPKGRLSNFFKDALWNGTQGCPIGILMKPEAARTNRKQFSPNFFKFNNNRFYPFLMREFTVGYFVCDENASRYYWRRYHPDDPGIALDQQVVYDATLGLFVTRGATYCCWDDKIAGIPNKD